MTTGFLRGTNVPLGWPQSRFCHGQIFSRREDKGSSLSLANSNFNGNCILEIPLSSLFVQIIGRFEFTIRFESLGWILRLNPWRKLTEIWPNYTTKTTFSRTGIILSKRLGRMGFFRRNVQAGREIGVWILQALLFLYDSLNISEWFKL